MYAFDIARPTTLDEAKAAIAAGGQALSGGQTLIPTLKARLAMPETLVSLHGIADLKGVSTDSAGRICVKGATVHRAVAEAVADSFPALSYLASRIGDPAVRNRGTIGGSVANNDPSACYPAAVLACDATVCTDRREIAADDYFQGMFTTALEEDEIVTEVKFPVPQAAAYEKFIQPASRFPLVAVFVARFADGVRVAITGASESGVFRWSAAEEALSANFTPDALDGLSVDADGMIGDLHGSKDYRAHLCGVMAKRAVARAV
ncbi:carbon-monoxide dehydrogenase medium subunit [Loktanella sp. DSM 29012]|uniref:FAD binding domain-containing protein n=1 Tax=Loktanella sp. DSM 29012 TaxID=1881056 RepID=UPI0008CE590A|nr:xanthine dehydrogenase family protein subunit M [Loktanella sp. DSM 29012]SEQ68133.1 carbon-monoxide dehydrogenase medium subunit [Loktanella sp. DSM 29012]